jgi:hypothetical protein
MTMAICPVCDRHFQTTAPYAQQKLTTTNSWATVSPYSYSASDAYAAKPQAYDQDGKTKMDWVPFIVALLGLPWLGMILNHQFGKGTMYLMAMLCIAACVFFGLGSPLVLLIGVLGGIAAYVIGLLDVYAIAQRFARSEDVREWDWF